MYRIRLASGEESVYRTAEELALAVRSGMVLPTAEVFHKSGNRWLPIKSHPDYIAVASGKRPSVALTPTPEFLELEEQPRPGPEPNGPATPSGSRTQGLAREEVAPEDHWGSEAAPPSPEDQHFPTGRKPTLTSSSGALRFRSALATAVALMGVVVVAAGSATAWRKLLPLFEPGQAVEGRSSAAVRRPTPGDSLKGLTTASADRLPAAGSRRAGTDTTQPGVQTSRLRATRNRAPTYVEAYADARAEMDQDLDYIRFYQIFSASRLSQPESLRATRRAVGAAGNILRVYRGREVMLEQTFRPADPGGRGSFREPFETSEAGRAVLSDADSLFGILVSQSGLFRLDSGGVRFEDPRARDAYATLRERLLGTLESWSDSLPSQDMVVMPRLIRALTSPTPPPLRP